MKNLRFIVISLAIALGGGSLLYFFAAKNYISNCTIPRSSCLQHRLAGCNLNGDYDVQVGTSITEVTCDMKSDRGGWTLIANYLHSQDGPGGPTVLDQGKFPLQDSTTLGSNESGKPSWGHASTDTLRSLPFNEMRFRCQTSAHKRLLDFTITSKKCLDYLKSGNGSCIENTSDIRNLHQGSRGLDGNNAFLPAVADKAWKDQGEYALTNYPFFMDFSHHWAVGVLAGRFECDDYAHNKSADTFHQIWVR